ncbi:MAG: FAD-binding protein [Planctomycetota bacterium]|nr:MAG: FAD-binding protein [Planctomycetota bacterium]
MSAPRYARVDDAFVTALEAEIGAECVSRAPEALERHARDESDGLYFPPELVVQPRATEQVQALLRLCSERRVPVTPAGGRTGLSGGALCVHGGVALSLARMDRIVEIDERNFFCVVEAGVVTERLQEAVEARGLFYPPDPASRGSCTIGGNIAENAGGPRAVKYGVTADWVRGLACVLADGTLLRTGGKLRKDVTGYDLTHLIVGSEGTLAVVTRAWLRLTTRPTAFRTALVPFASAEAAVALVPAIAHAGLDPAAIEFMERAALEAACAQLGVRVGHDEAQAYLLIELDGTDEARLDREIERLGELCLERGALDVWLALEPGRRRELWALRRAMGEAVKRLSAYREEDTVVPRARLAEALAAVGRITARHGVRAITYGHAGDGNIHVNVLQGELDPERWATVSRTVSREIFEAIVALGGTITGEHGVGCVQKDNLPIALSRASLALQRRLKTAFDPGWILNPGKLFDPE